MDLQITLSADAEKQLRLKAAAVGMEPKRFAERMLERALIGSILEELLAPVRAEFEASGMTEEELIELLETAKHEMRAEERKRKAS